MEVAVATVDPPLHRLPQSTKLKTRPLRLPQKTMRLVHPNPVAHHLPSLRDLTQALTDTVPHLPRFQRVTTHTMDMVLTTDGLAAVAVADVVDLGVAAATLDPPLVFPHLCRI
jgi:hypothetical protein